MRIDGQVVDEAASYLGLRTTGIDRGDFLLNGEPCFVRSVLEQGYWPASHLTAPTLGVYREEIELIKELGFNAARIHQKVEDPRFLFWADRLGLLIWGETANACAFSPRAAAALTAEWTEIVEQVRPPPERGHLGADERVLGRPSSPTTATSSPAATSPPCTTTPPTPTASPPSTPTRRRPRRRSPGAGRSDDARSTTPLST